MLLLALTHALASLPAPSTGLGLLSKSQSSKATWQLFAGGTGGPGDCLGRPDLHSVFACFRNFTILKGDIRDAGRFLQTLQALLHHCTVSVWLCGLQDAEWGRDWSLWPGPRQDAGIEGVPKSAAHPTPHAPLRQVPFSHFRAIEIASKSRDHSVCLATLRVTANFQCQLGSCLFRLTMGERNFSLLFEVTTTHCASLEADGASCNASLDREVFQVGR